MRLQQCVIYIDFVSFPIVHVSSLTYPIHPEVKYIRKLQRLKQVYWDASSIRKIIFRYNQARR